MSYKRQHYEIIGLIESIRCDLDIISLKVNQLEDLAKGVKNEQNENKK
jgi:hypothetical protein